MSQIKKRDDEGDPLPLPLVKKARYFIIELLNLRYGKGQRG